MRPLIDEPDDIPAEAVPVCAEVCRAVEEWDGNPDGLEFLAAMKFGQDWFTAWRYTSRNSRCGRLIAAACDALALRQAAFVSDGQIFTPELIGENDGKIYGGRVLVFPERYDKDTGLPVYPFVQAPF